MTSPLSNSEIDNASRDERSCQSKYCRDWFELGLPEVAYHRSCHEDGEKHQRRKDEAEGDETTYQKQPAANIRQRESKNDSGDKDGEGLLIFMNPKDEPREDPNNGREQDRCPDDSPDLVKHGLWSIVLRQLGSSPKSRAPEYRIPDQTQLVIRGLVPRIHFSVVGKPGGDAESFEKGSSVRVRVFVRAVLCRRLTGRDWTRSDTNRSSAGFRAL
jgi:hypothetical protein